MVRSHKEPLLKAVDELLTHEVLDGNRFREIVLGPVPPPATPPISAPI